MKHPFRILLYLALAALSVAAEESTKKPPVPAPLAPIAFLVGGVWQGTLPPGPDGGTMGIELRAEWTGNHQAVRFESAWVRAGKTSPYTSGLYVWDGARQQIGIFYVDAEGGLAHGALTQEGATLVHDFTITSPDGKATPVRTRLTPEGSDAYLNEIFLSKDGAWQKFVEVRYARKAR